MYISGIIAPIYYDIFKALVPQTVANVLGVCEEPGRTLLATLIDWLHPRQILLILNHCEHLIDACARLADAVLHAGPETQALASSREALGIAGESAYRVPSLTCPNALQASHESAKQLTQYAAVRLFIERATQSLTTFTLTTANASAVAQICYRLDGIPLAIELAAARARGLSIEQIAARLDNSFQLLTGGSRTAPSRQQTLRALIDWSYNLLSEPERQLLQRLAVFAGGWTLEAAETVGAGEGIEQHEILDLLLRLENRSLIAMVEREGQSRYRLLETVRQYARDKLFASGRSELVRDRHLRWFTQLAEEMEPRLRSAEYATVLAMLEEDFDNLRTAITWAVERQSEAALRLVGALFEFWYGQGHIHEGRALAERVLASFGALPDLGGETSSGPLREGTDHQARARAEAKTLRAAGSLAFPQGEYFVAQSYLQAAETRARVVGDGTILGYILIGQDLVRLYQGDHTKARALYDQSVMLARHAGQAWDLAFALWFLGDALAIDDPDYARNVYEESLSLFRQAGDRDFARLPLTGLAHLASEQGDYAQARAHLEESLAIRRKGANKYGTSITLNSLAEVVCHQQDYDSAAPLCEEALILSRAPGNKSAIAWSLRNLAEVADGRGDVQRAEELLRESLGLYRELGQKRDAAQVIEALTKIALAQGRPEQAAVLLGAADALRQSIKTRLSSNLRADNDRNVAAARAQLGDVSFEAQFAEGHKLTLEQAIALALADEPW